MVLTYRVVLILAEHLEVVANDRHLVRHCLYIYFVAWIPILEETFLFLLRAVSRFEIEVELRFVSTNREDKLVVLGHNLRGPEHS